jgi:predicted GIY-YIG superfamily endonuclease
MNPFTYVYILKSEIAPEHFYVGRTRDLRTRVFGTTQDRSLTRRNGNRGN